MAPIPINIFDKPIAAVTTSRLLLANFYLKSFLFYSIESYHKFRSKFFFFCLLFLDKFITSPKSRKRLEASAEKMIKLNLIRCTVAATQYDDVRCKILINAHRQS